VEEDLTPELTAGVTIHYASRIEDVLAVALPLLKPQAAVHSIEDVQSIEQAQPVSFAA